MDEKQMLLKNKYLIPSTRLPGWDYSSHGWYFITICIKNRKECLFGEVIDNEMRLNSYGQIVREEWEKSFQIRKELTCETYVIMPDHIHGLIGIIKTNEWKNGNVNAEMGPDGFLNAQTDVETHGRASLPATANPNPVTDVMDAQTDEKTHGRASLPATAKMPHRVPKSISSFVAGFKSVVTKRLNEIRNTPRQPLWQTRFYDRIIRDEKAFLLVQLYINENPRKRWTKQGKDV